jgi:hypothetical protein
VRHLWLDRAPKTAELLECLKEKDAQRRELPFGTLLIQPQSDLTPSSKWFARASARPLAPAHRDDLVVPLCNLAKVVRGIATGANEFFALTEEQVKNKNLGEVVVRTIGRNREVQGIVLDEPAWRCLAEEGKRIWLLYLDGDEPQASVKDYILEGERARFHLRSLVGTRRKWHMMERREVPPIFFTLLTRGNPRFILNRAGVRPLNMFLLVYPNKEVVESGNVEVLWALLNSSFSLSRLPLVSRTYGGNTLKVEPRELDNLPVVNPFALSEDAVRELKLGIEEFNVDSDAGKLLQSVNEIVNAALG